MSRRESTLQQSGLPDSSDTVTPAPVETVAAPVSSAAAVRADPDAVFMLRLIRYTMQERDRFCADGHSAKLEASTCPPTVLADPIEYVHGVADADGSVSMPCLGCQMAAVHQDVLDSLLAAHRTQVST